MTGSTTMTKFERAFLLALVGHSYQTDKAGNPYIQHLMRVAGSVEPDHMPVAMLHDYLEDVYHSLYDVEEVRFFFNFLTSTEADALFILTRALDETYRQYIERIATSGNDIAIKVKLADLNDHLTHGLPLSDTLYADLYFRYKTAQKRLLDATQGLV
jgi:hypothetical protein